MDLSVEQLAACLRAIGSAYPVPLPKPTTDSHFLGMLVVEWHTPRVVVRAWADSRCTWLCSRRVDEPLSRTQVIPRRSDADLVDRLWGLFDWLCHVETEPHQGTLGFTVVDATGTVEGGVL